MTESVVDCPSWDRTLLTSGATIQQAIWNLESSSQQIVLVVLPSGGLVGTLTDGDIRRGFLNGLDLQSPVDAAVNKKPLVVPPGIDRDTVIEIMRSNAVKHMPVVDNAGKVVGLFVCGGVFAPMALDNPMVIMAGGRGMRLRPHTEACPKPMLEVSGKPMLLHIMEKAKADGFTRFFISVNYLGEVIESYFGDGSEFGVEIEYIKERTPLGTAGSLTLLENKSGLAFVVTNGDVLTDIQYNEILDFHHRHNADATMAVRPYEIQNQFGVVHINGVELEGFEEKPIYRSHINAGVYVFNPSVMELLDFGAHCDMPELFNRIKLNAGRSVVYPMHEPWLDVGKPEDLHQANENKI